MTEPRVAPQIRKRALEQASFTELRTALIHHIEKRKFPAEIAEQATAIVDERMSSLQTEMMRLELCARVSKEAAIADFVARMEADEETGNGADAPPEKPAKKATRKRR